MKRLIAAFCLFPFVAFAGVGEVTSFKGNPAEAKRDSEELTVEEIGFSIEMLDQLITAKTRLGITFEDKSKVEITEQSKLVIDDFIYDPNTGVGKMSMKVALGTVQMTSGLIAKNNRERTSIRTPTASITVRGTDFSMTVDEIGRSLIILLPSCPDPTLNEDECPVGSIEVSTDAGSVTLTEKYEGTLVSNGAMLPSDPRKLLLDKGSIDNNLIIVPPSEFPNGFNSEEIEEEITSLDADLLEYEELSTDFLEEDLFSFSELDINRLENKYLDNFFSFLGGELSVNELDIPENTTLPNIKNYPWVVWVVNEDSILLDSERPPHISILRTSIDTHGTYNLVQDDYKADIQIQDGGTEVSIKVVQLQ